MSKGTDLIVIGAGLSGLTAAAHAVKAGASVRLIAQGWGQQIVAPGWISVWDNAEGDVLAAAASHTVQHPDHPYALCGIETLRTSLNTFQKLTQEIGLPFASRGDGLNWRLPTMLGAIQTPYLTPSTLGFHLDNIEHPILIVGFSGWRDFHPELVSGNLERQGIPARALRIDIPGEFGSWDAWPGDLARLFDRDDFRKMIIKQVASYARQASLVGFPAVLGLEHPRTAALELDRYLHRPVFEIPALPPSLPGTRLSNRLRRWLLRHRARVQIGHPVIRPITENGRVIGVNVAALGHTNPFYADHVILATGGLYNGGIQSDESGKLWEPIFDLPVSGPGGDRRAGWYADTLLDPNGHPIHRHTGLRANANLQPLNAEGAPAYANLYAVGHLLAGFNPLVDGCAEGVALATAYKAVQVALNV
jgi:glycerol-3-phosphate dehydrogenase subunit B